MKKSKTALIGLCHALGVFAYIGAVSLFMSSLDGAFSDNAPGSLPEFMAPLTMLTLLVFSVALMGLLIFGRPILMYMRGERKDAVRVLVATMSFLFLFLAALTIGIAELS